MNPVNCSTRTNASELPMINEPTVLVLGAGASCPYGFPTARGLKRLICDAFPGPEEGAASEQLADRAGCDPIDFWNFREAFLRSGQPSIDAFLEHRPDFLKAGKIAIAYCLVPFEDEAALYDFDEIGDRNWYEHLAVKLSGSFDDFGFNRIGIITFNYDRSLEHYLVTSLQNLHGRSLADSVAALERIPIVHVYGQLGINPYPGCMVRTTTPEFKRSGCRRYLPDRDDEWLVAQAAEGITLVHEQGAQDNVAAGRDLLTAAKRICFLGFGYHSLNVSRLQIDTENAGSKFIVGTSQGLEGADIGNAQKSVQDALGSAIQLENCDNLRLLKLHGVLG